MTRTLRPPIVSVLAMLLFLLPVAGTLLAAEADQESGPITSMKAGDGLSDLEERRLKFLFWAYMSIWTLMAIYLVSISLRLRSVGRELQRMRERIERGAGGAAG